MLSLFAGTRALMERMLAEPGALLFVSLAMVSLSTRVVVFVPMAS